MAIPKLWYNGGTPGNKNFIYSHAKAVYYNYKEQKLLSDKLDEMDTSIAASVTKAMMSDTDADDSNKVPTSKFVHGLSGKIENLESILLTPEMRRNIYRGQSLGTSVTEEQWTAIQNGTFTDMFIGDYWTIDGTTYRIADMNYWLNCGDTAFKTNHLVIVTDENMGNQRMNASNDTTGGYVLSEMYTTNLATAKAKIKKDFGEAHVLMHRENLVNATKDGYPSACPWGNSDIELMSELMVYGSHVFAPMPNGTIVPANYTISKTQLSLFRLNPKAITTGYHYWLRDVVSGAAFASVNYVGRTDCHDASNSLGVRPVFPIGSVS